MSNDLKSVLIDKSQQATEKSPDFMAIYANNVHMGISLFDFSLIFGEVTDAEKDGKVVVNQKVRVILSKEMAKVLSALLAQNVAAYEEEYGTIVVPQPKAKLASAAKPKPVKR
jgi:hypothetical protein